MSINRSGRRTPVGVRVFTGRSEEGCSSANIWAIHTAVVTLRPKEERPVVAEARTKYGTYVPHFAVSRTQSVAAGEETRNLAAHSCQVRQSIAEKM